MIRFGGRADHEEQLGRVRPDCYVAAAGKENSNGLRRNSMEKNWLDRCDEEC